MIVIKKDSGDFFDIFLLKDLKNFKLDLKTFDLSFKF